MNVDGNLTITAADYIEQCSDTSIQAGSLEFNSDGSIIQHAASSGHNTTLTVDNNATMNAGAGGIKQDVPGTEQIAPTMNIGGNTYLTTSGDIELASANNDFNSDSSQNGQIYINDGAEFNASSASITDNNGINLGNINIAAPSVGVTGDLTVKELSGNIVQCKSTAIEVGGDITLIASGGISQTAPSASTDPETSIKAGGKTTLTAGTTSNIKLDQTNDFTGEVTTTQGNNVELTDENSIIIGLTEISGDFTVKANNSSSAGATESTITTTGDIIAQGNVQLLMLDNNTNAGSITLDNNITGNTIWVQNQSSTTGTDVVINSTSTLTETSTSPTSDPNPLVVCSEAGNFTNNSGADVFGMQSGQRWLVYTGSPEDTTLGGLAPANTFYSSTIDDPIPSDVPSGNSVLYRTPAPPTPGGGGGGGAGGIVAGSIGGAAAAGGAAAINGLGLLPGLLLGLASPIQFDECMIDIIDQSQDSYPMLVRNMQHVFQTCDISKLDPCKIGSTRFIPDQCINNGSYELIKVKIPEEFANAPKGITIKITQKSCPYGISKNIPDMNFNVFNTLSDKQIRSIYQTRKFLRPNYIVKHTTTMKTGSHIDASKGIIQKTLSICPQETKNDLSIAVNYLKNGQFPRKNSNLKLDKQTYSLVIQFIENK